MFQLPNEPFLRELFHQWQLQPDLIIIRDAKTGQKVALHTLLRDVSLAREQLLVALSESDRARLQKKHQDVYIMLLVPPAYQFIVLFLAIYSLGAVSVPLTTAIHPEEAEFFIGLCGATLLVATHELKEQAVKISTRTSIRNMVHELSTVSSTVEDIQLSNDLPVDMERGASLLFTSGTTAKPKGVLHSRRALYEQARASSEFQGFTSHDLYLLSLPTNWVGGFGMLIFCLYSAMPMELCAAVFGPKWFWQRIQACEVTCFISSSPSISRIQAYYEEHSATWTDAERHAAKAGVSKMKLIEAGAMPVTNRTKSFWAKLRDGQRFQVDYGMTETMLLITATKPGSTEMVLPNCVGVPLPGVNIKIAEDDEILLKTPGMFTRYLSEDLKATQKAFDEDGYFKTGDVGRMVGQELYVLGRASTDGKTPILLSFLGSDEPVIRFDGYKVFGPEVEEYLRRLDFISVAWVVGVPDEAKHYRVGGLIALNDGRHHDLEEIRSLLSDLHGVNAYKLPTLLRVLKEGESVPLTSTSGKPNKKRIVQEFFSESDMRGEAVEVLTLETNPVGKKPFDWAGLPYVA